VNQGMRDYLMPFAVCISGGIVVAIIMANAVIFCSRQSEFEQIQHAIWEVLDAGHEN